MAVLNVPDRLFSFEARKKFGVPSYYGESVYGFSRYGQEPNWFRLLEYGERDDGVKEYCDSFYFEGIYQMRPSGSDRVCVIEKFYMPTESSARVSNPRRGVFANAVLAWQELSTSQKEVYRVKSNGRRMSGYNIFLREFLISH